VFAEDPFCLLSNCETTRKQNLEPGLHQCAAALVFPSAAGSMPSLHFFNMTIQASLRDRLEGVVVFSRSPRCWGNGITVATKTLEASDISPTTTAHLQSSHYPSTCIDSYASSTIHIWGSMAYLN
jgi:hypothetical protein